MLLHLMSLAWRNLWRNGRRTVLTLISIAFGGFLAVLFTGFQDQSFAAVIDRAARLGGGHVTIQHQAYQDGPTVSRTVEHTDRLRARALKNAQVERAVDRISGEAMVATATGSYGVHLLAYDPSVEDGTTLELTGKLDSGHLFDSQDTRGVVLGKRLASNLEVGVGDKVVYTMTNKEGEMVSGMGRVRGLIKTGSQAVDGSLFVMPLSAARRVLDLGEREATQVAIFINDARRAPAVARDLAPDNPQQATLTWRETQPQLASFIAMKVGGARFMEAVILLVVAAGIFNTLFVSVMERTRELGILLAIGYTPGQIRTLILLESWWLAWVGIGLGAVLTLWPYLRLSRTGLDLQMVTGTEMDIDAAGVPFDPVIPFGAFPEHIALIVVVVFLTTLAAGLLPAWRAGRIDPVESIKLV